jgi:hypothetical protein
MSKNTKTFGKDALCNFFPSAGSALKQEPGTKNSAIKQNKQQKSLNTLLSKKPPENKPSVEKAVYTTHTQEISFEEFLKSKHKKP